MRAADAADAENPALGRRFFRMLTPDALHEANDVCRPNESPTRNWPAGGAEDRQRPEAVRGELLIGARHRRQPVS
jgi:hypothetical protein